MKFFIDTANLEQIRKAHELGVLDGVTTNPSLMAKENIRGTENCNRHYVEICNIVEGDVSAEVIATDFEGMVREGEVLAALHPRIVVKLPCTAAGIRAVKYFAAKDIRTNCTLVFSVGQALLAAKAGATYVSPFVGRLDDISEDDVAKSVGVSRSHLYRVFMLNVGKSPIDYLTEYRVNEACKLLRGGTLSIAEVAASVGFLDQFYFSRVFKRAKGVPPSKYMTSQADADVQPAPDET